MHACMHAFMYVCIYIYIYIVVLKITAYTNTTSWYITRTISCYQRQNFALFVASCQRPNGSLAANVLHLPFRYI